MIKLPLDIQNFTSGAMTPGKVWGGGNRAPHSQEMARKIIEENAHWSREYEKSR